MLEEAAYVYWLKNVPGFGNGAIKKCMDLPGGAKTVFEADEKTLMGLNIGLKAEKIESLLMYKKEQAPESLYEKLLKKGIRLTWIGAKDYPARLSQIPDPPFVLFYKGKLLTEQKKHVAVVGARECTEYGAYMARTLGEALAQADCTLVSGMARGIDGMSQKAALMHGGASIGVLGCGVDICYPRQNADLYERLAAEGCLVSEYLPGTQPVARLFPARNRIISGLSDVLVVIEAREKSGTFITVDMALEQGREVYAVPGRLTDPLSVGCNKLIHQGANVFTDIEDFLGQMGAQKNIYLHDVKTMSMETDFVLTEQEKLLYKTLDIYPRNVDEIVLRVGEKAQMNLQEVMWGLLQLCIKGIAKQVGYNSYVRTL